MQRYILFRYELSNMNASKVVRVISYFLFGFIFLFLTLTISFNYYINEKFSSRLKEEFSERTGFKYTLSFDKLSINFFTQKISLDNAIISPLKNNASSAEFVVTASYFKIIDFSILTYLRTKNLEINKIEVINPHVSYYLNDSAKFPELFVKKDLSNYLKSISINNFDIINCDINVYHRKDDLLPFLKSKENSLSLKNITVNFENNHNQKLFIFKDVDFVLNYVEYNLPDSLYTLYGKKVHVSFSKSTLQIDSLKLVPNYSKKDFADKVKFQASRIEIITSKFNVNNIDYNRLYKDYFFSAKKLEIAGCFLNVYRDNTKFLEHNNKPSLQTLLKNIPILFSIDTIELKNGRIDFEALQPLASSTGKIFVDKVYLNVFDVCNDTLTMNDTNFIKADFGGYVLGKAKFTESYVFPMNCKGETFSCSGSLSAIPLSSFNSIVKPAKHILFKEGQLDDVVFVFDAKEKFSTGSMTFKYHDLKIDVLNRRNNKGGLKSLISTLVLNNFKINKSNPGADGKTRTVKLFVKNNPYRYFLFYSMQTILSGIEPTILKE
jgi:hypothetical protein